RAALFFRDLRMKLGVPPNVQFIDDRAIPGNLVAARLLAPLERRINNHALGPERGGVALVKGKVGIFRTDGVAEAGVIPGQRPDVCAGVGIEQEFIVIESVPFFWFVRSVDPIAVYRTGLEFRYISVPYFVGKFWQIDALTLFRAFLVEQTQLDPCGVCGKQGEIDALSVPHGAAREWLSFLNLDTSSVFDHFRLYRSRRHRSVTHFVGRFVTSCDANWLVWGTGAVEWMHKRV